jgi:hypothetical protein
MVAQDNAGILKPFRSQKARAFTEGNVRGQIYIGTTPLTLEMLKNLDIELVEGS